MKANLSIETTPSDNQNDVLEIRPEDVMRERLLALELQVKIFKQAETIGEIGNWQINLNNFETWYSDNVFRIYGLEPFSIASHPDTFNAFLHDDDRDVVLNAFEKSYQEKIPLHLEFRIRRQDGQLRHINIVSTVTKNPRGEPLLTGITQDISDRKSLEMQLREVAERIQLQNESFRHAEQIGSFGTWQVNLNTRQTRYSENYYRIFGLRPSAVAPGFEEFLNYVHPDDKIKFRELIKRIFEEEQPADGEFQIIRNDGKARFVQVKSKALKNGDGDQLIVGVIKDISPAVRLEKQLKDINEHLSVQNEAFRQAERITEMGSWTWNLFTNRVEFSDHIFHLHGVKPQSGDASFEIIEQVVHPMDKPVMKKLLESLRLRPEEMDFSYRINRPDGKTRHMRTRCHSVNAADGHVLVIGTTQDITEELMLNQKLNERMQFAEMLSENIIDCVCITNRSNIIIGWNTSSETAFGVTKQAVIGKNIFDAFPHSKTAENIERYKKVLSGEVIHIPQLKPYYLEGAYELTMLPIIEPGKQEVSAVITILHDITEFQRLKEQLEERLEFIEKLVESSVDRIKVLDRNMRFLYWNKRSEEHYGLAKEKVIGKNLLEIFPLIRRDIVFEKMKMAWKGETVHLPVDRDEVTKHYSDAYLVPIKNSADHVVALLWIAHDLTEQVLAEREIKRQNNLLESVLNAPNVGVNVYKCVRDESGHIVDFEFVMVSRRGQELLGRTDLVGKLLLEEYPFNEEMLDDLLRLIETGETYNYEHNHVINGKSSWISNSNAKFGDGFINVWEDITDKKLAEQELKMSKDLLQSIFDTSQSGIAVMQAIRNDGNEIVDFEFRLINEYGRNLMGADYQGKRQFAVYPEGHDFFQLCKSVTESAIPVDTESIYSSNESSRWFRITAAKLGDGLVVGFDDITRRKKSEEEIARQTSLLMQTEESANVGSWELDPLTNIFTWSDQMFRIYDYVPQSFVPTLQFYLNTIGSDDIEYVKQIFDAAKQGDRFSISHRLHTLDGRILYVRVKGQTVRSEVSSSNVIRGTLQDITDRKEIEDELKLKRDAIRLQHQIERQAEKMRQFGNWQWNLTSGEMIWGENLFVLFGLEPYSVEPSVRTFIDAIHPEDQERILNTCKEIQHMADQEFSPFEFRVLINDEVRYLRSAGRKISTTVGSLVVGSTTDFTDDALLHIQLAERMNFAEALIDSSVDRILALDKELRILAWNRKCQEIYGYTKEQVVGRYLVDFFPKIKENDILFSPFEVALRGETVHIPAERAVYSPGYIEAHYIPLRRVEGEVYGVLNIIHDVTDRIHSERELRDLNSSLFYKNKELQEINDELSSFAFIASHDLREPLRKVQVFTDRLLQNEIANLSKGGQDEFNRIRTAVKRMDELIDDVLNFSSISSSANAFSEFDLNQVLNDVKVDMAELINAKQAVIESSHLPKIEGNPSHFSHLFRNLLANALKFQPEQQIPFITIEHAQVEGTKIGHPYANPDSLYLLITFTDNGIGFEQQYEHRIFQMFQRLHGMHEYSGNGMGLAICKKVVETYQGFITVQSTPGQGATFNCYFKLK
jgi:PAS domain S-box-containing protein